MTESNPNIPDPLDCLVEEFAERLRRGERLSLEEAIQQYPGFAEEIRDIFPALVELEEVLPRPTSTPSRSPATPELPATFGEFRLVREIGRGGMGIVYEAEQQTLRRRVALKILPTLAAANANHRERFQREAESASRLHHTNIVSVFGVGAEHGIPFYAMQYIRGRSLHEVLQTLQTRTTDIEASPAEEDVSSRLASALLVDSFTTVEEPAEQRTSALADPKADVSEVVSICDIDNTSVMPMSVAERSAVGPAYFHAVARLGIQAAEALAYAHGQGILHRDIKPANLHLDTRGTLWIMDFGLAKAEGLPHLTASGDVVGTLRYLPPERFQGDEDARGDVYSLGLTLYEMLTLRPAFDSLDRPDLMDRVLRAEPQPPRAVNADIPRDLETIVLKCIHKEPDRRYGSAQAVADDLRRYLDGEPIHARRVNLWQRTLMRIRRRPAVALSVFLTVVTLMALAGVANFFALNVRLRSSLYSSERAEAEAQTQQRRAEEALAKTSRLHYGASLVLAQSELPDKPDPLRRYLVKVPERLRGWEWSLLCERHGLEPGRFDKHTGAIYALAIAPDGKHVATGGKERVVRLWELDTRKEIGRFPRSDFDVGKLVFSADGTYLAASSPQRTDSVIWRVATRAKAMSLPGAVMAFRSDGRHLVYLPPQGLPTVMDLKTRTPAFTLEGKSGTFRNVAYSPNGKLLATTSSTHAAQLWDAQTGASLRELRAKGGTWRNYGLAFTPDSRYLAGFMDDKTLAIWKLATGRVDRSFSSDKWNGQDLAFSPHGRHLVTLNGGRVEIWRWKMKKLVRTLLLPKNAFTAMALRRDGKRLVTVRDYQIPNVWSLEPRMAPTPISSSGPPAFHPDGQRLACPDKNWILVRDIKTGNVGFGLDAESPVTRLAFSKDGKRLASVSCVSSKKTVVRIWDPARRRCVRTIEGQMHFPQQLGFTDDDKFLVLAYHHYTLPFRPVHYGVKVWDAKTGEQVRSLDEELGAFTSCVLSADGRYLALAFHDAIRIWETHTGKVLRAFPMQGKPLRAPILGPPGAQRPFVPPIVVSSALGAALAFSPDGDDLAITYEGRLVVWDWRTDRQRPLPEIPYYHEHAVFSPDGERFLATQRDQLFIWDAETGQHLMSLKEYLGNDSRSYAIADLTFSPDGSKFAVRQGNTLILRESMHRR